MAQRQQVNIIPQKTGIFDKLGPIGTIGAAVVGKIFPIAGAAMGVIKAAESNKQTPQAVGSGPNANVNIPENKGQGNMIGSVMDFGKAIYDAKSGGSDTTPSEQYKGDIPEGDSAIDRRLQFQQDDYGKQLEESRNALASLPPEQRKLYEAPILQAYQKYQYGNRRV